MPHSIIISIALSVSTLSLTVAIMPSSTSFLRILFALIPVVADNSLIEIGSEIETLPPVCASVFACGTCLPIRF